MADENSHRPHDEKFTIWVNESMVIPLERVNTQLSAMLSFLEVHTVADCPEAVEIFQEAVALYDRLAELRTRATYLSMQASLEQLREALQCHADRTDPASQPVLVFIRGILSNFPPDVQAEVTPWFVEEPLPRACIRLLDGYARRYPAMVGYLGRMVLQVLGTRISLN